MADSKTVRCDEHGDRRAAFICKHLSRGLHLGFYTPDGPSDNLQAWCGLCERVRVKCGGEWNEKSEEYVGAKLVCDRCFEKARERNEVEDIDPPMWYQLAALAISLVLLLIALVGLAVLLGIPWDGPMERGSVNTIAFLVLAFVSLPICFFVGWKFVARLWSP